MISPASVIWFSGNKHFNDTRRTAVEECTKASIYTPSKFCDLSSAVSANAHVITDAVAREVSSGFFRAFKRSYNVLPSLDHTQFWKNHVWARLLMPVAVVSFQYCFRFNSCTSWEDFKIGEFLHSKSNHYDDFSQCQTWNRHLFLDYGFFANTGSEMDLHLQLCSNKSPIQFKLYNCGLF